MHYTERRPYKSTCVQYKEPAKLVPVIFRHSAHTYSDLSDERLYLRVLAMSLKWYNLNYMEHLPDPFP